MKHTVYREAFFSAAHHLRNYNGKCENIHGHNWRVRVSVSSGALDSDGFVIDFKLLDKIINMILDRLDHHDINEVSPFDKINPTAENISLFILEEADRSVKEIRNDLYVSQVDVWESEKSCASVEV